MKFFGLGFNALVTFALMLCAGAAHSETINCTAITTVPYTISAPGVYCVTQKITSNLASGAAITIAANNVVLDLNDFAIGNLGAGPSTIAYGIYAVDRQNIVVKNGILRGFWIGVALLDGTSVGLTTALSSGHIVDGITSDHSYLAGIALNGPDCTVRNSRVLATQGSIVVNSQDPTQVNKAIGIAIGQGGNAYIYNNTVLDTDCVNGCTAASAAAGGIYVQNAPNAVIEANTVMNASLSAIATAFGIVANDISPNVLIEQNVVSTAAVGILYDTATGATGKYRGNVTQGTTTPYSGGTPIGTNY